MKKQLILITAFASFVTLTFGGGIVTNTNQSAIWVRTLNRDASTGIDAVYFNPAGLTKLTDGIHLSLNNQFIFQSKDVTTDLSMLYATPKTFYGDVKALLFPGVYAAWKKNKIAISFGFNPIGGGGGAEFKEGLPPFDLMVGSSMLSTVIPALNGALTGIVDVPYSVTPATGNVTDYAANIYFKGTSAYLGYQLGASYAINDMISVALGVRYVSAKNTYTGHISDLSVIPATGYGTNPMTPGDYLRYIATDPGEWGLTPLTIGTLTATASGFDGMLADSDVEVDVEEKGNGITPIVGVNLAFLENKLNIGFKPAP